MGGNQNPLLLGGAPRRGGQGSHKPAEGCWKVWDWGVRGSHVSMVASVLKIAECREKVTRSQLCSLFPNFRAQG